VRKKQLEITDKSEIKKILETTRVGRLATLGEDGYPYITPVNYVYFQESVYFHCALKGEKLDNIRRYPKVCFEVDIPLAYLDTGFDKNMPTCDVGQFYQCVIIRGRAEIIDQLDKKVSALNALMASHEAVKVFSDITGETKAVSLCSVVAIRIDSLTAKANMGQKNTTAEKEKISNYLKKRDLPGDLKAAELIW